MASHDLEEKVIALYGEDKWKEIINLKNVKDTFEKYRLLWVWPSLDDLQWIKDIIDGLQLHGIISIGCGSGLLEWLIQKHSGIDVVGIEVDHAWWTCGYSPPLFLKKVIFIDEDNNNVEIPKSHALLFCYFNNAPAFLNYIMNYSGSTVLVIGPGEGRGSHTDPTPFDKKFSDLGWQLYKFREIGNTKDYIAVYTR
ncbi:uncharacterized protein LOC107263687 [Cephus cinctus]|uniref:Uncharacterized protein LOC107263687 n=1 Tax=Cephus cinctus TaxID=211228 RepID=A0AAJ7VXX6_CEPCN|nr:uncharacterized protein LOC107263687 [Cephus cinctus]XP_024936841.1 uncharacterized protein LOC107263687 [Cephus cinctus]XP_024936842.1 uncharacterized protein LOC107263687 [Cephus cinctus]XP_024936843.1 uncharacterized protein LOC107263687 [Cephus cinctus]XP_024936844.1 uncharacterized protein LOC107263687 [Cephus cinctus]XP_024936845.1 uncharacterized protein LOC107263687 [Cephus cinctus]XP_024936846.1 uncharacterized protein LOC107263687 [Cephus cinctus]XP_024936847.1 uncharacterized p